MEDKKRREIKEERTAASKLFGPMSRFSAN